MQCKRRIGEYSFEAPRLALHGLQPAAMHQRWLVKAVRCRTSRLDDVSRGGWMATDQHTHRGCTGLPAHQHQSRTAREAAAIRIATAEKCDAALGPGLGPTSQLNVIAGNS